MHVLFYWICRGCRLSEIFGWIVYGCIIWCRGKQEGLEGMGYGCRIDVRVINYNERVIREGLLRGMGWIGLDVMGEGWESNEMVG